MKEQIQLNFPEKADCSFEEAIKTLRTNVEFCGRNMRRLLFTSSLPDEGKSLISFAFARAQAQIGKKILYIDTDIRMSVMAFRYEIGRKVVGLSEYLTGHQPMEKIIYSTNAENLDVIFAGAYSPNPVELLEDDYFDRLLTYADDHYDMIVLDTPPIGNVIDGAIVAKRCDSAVIVVESGAISYRLLQKVKEQIELAGCRVLGVVLNKVKTGQSGYYTQYGKYKKYGKYGGYGYSRYEKDDRYGEHGIKKQKET